jgi:hypothetical protein
MGHIILDSAYSLEILKQDLKMFPKPKEDWNTLDPIEDGYYEAAGVLYQYKNGDLVEVKEEEAKEEEEN